MSAADEPLAYRRLRAPTDDGGALIDPPLNVAAAQLARRGPPFNIVAVDGPLGSELAAIRRDARTWLLDAARQYTASFTDVAAVAAEAPVVLSGHQPELFHPGVWFKNFVLDSLARHTGATAINLVIDNDLCGNAAVRVPAGSPGAPRWQAVPLDGSAPPTPYEQRAIVDLAVLRDFPPRVREALKPWGVEPLVDQLWSPLPELTETRRLGALLAQLRRRLEGAWGLSTLELPWSLVCDSPAFQRFAAEHLLAHRELAAAYNEGLRLYRRVNRLRSRTHPAPELESIDDWFEAPYWVWSDDDPTRRRLYVRRAGERWELTDRSDWRQSAPASITGLADALAFARRQGVKIRSRALITTMYARLVLGDLFVHGIGGAKYDQLTDHLIVRCYGLTPPPYVTATATCRLPLGAPAFSPRELALARHDLRELAYHGERYLPADTTTGAALLLAAKRAAIDNRAGWSPNERHRAIAAANAALAPLVEPIRRSLQAEVARLEHQREQWRILGSREHSFCLFPAEPLRSRLLAAAEGAG